MIGNPKKIDASGARTADCGACLDRAILGKDRQTGCQELSMTSVCFTDYWSIKMLFYHSPMVNNYQRKTS
jgi:hypothetical protein